MQERAAQAHASGVESDRGVVRASMRVLPPLLAAAVLGLLGRHDAALLVGGCAAALLVLGLLAPRAAAEFDRALERGATAIADALAVAVSVVGWTVLLLPVWGLRRLARSSPLDDRWIGPTSAWTVVTTERLRRPDGAPFATDRIGTVDPVPRATGGRAVRSLGALVMIVALAGATWWVVQRDGSADPDVVTAAPADESLVQARPLDAEEFDGLSVDGYAHDDEPWAAQHLGELQQMNYRPDPFLGAVPLDLRGEYVNVVDGRRVSYTPANPELTVWFFGGSTMFGIGQRDEHTIPSVVVRAAERDGLRLRAVNFGVPGYVNWQGTEAFEHALTSGLPRPDLAVFYDGVNDRGLGTFRLDIGATDTDAIARLPASDQERAEMRAAWGDQEPQPWSPAREELMIDLIAIQYRRGAEVARELGEAHGVPVVHVWQPWPFAKQPSAADEPLWERLDFDLSWLPGSTRTYAEIRTRSGIAPIDLTPVLDEVEVPVYFDTSHTNELGARLIGEELYRQLRPQLVQIQGGDG